MKDEGQTWASAKLTTMHPCPTIFIQTRCLTQIRQFLISPRTIREWNELPPEATVTHTHLMPVCQELADNISSLLLPPPTASPHTHILLHNNTLQTNNNLITWVQHCMLHVESWNSEFWKKLIAFWTAKSPFLFKTHFISFVTHVLFLEK